MTDNKYNGWTNYETWLCNLWYDDYWSDIAQDVYNEAEADSYFSKTEKAILDLEDRIKSEVEESINGQIPDNGFVTDLINAAMSEINFYEIAEHYIDDVDKTEDETDKEDDN